MGYQLGVKAGDLPVENDGLIGFTQRTGFLPEQALSSCPKTAAALMCTHPVHIGRYSWKIPGDTVPGYASL